MPELRDPPPDREMFRHQPQTGCHLCDARHLSGRVHRLLPHYTYVCLRHGRWIGPPGIDHPAVDLARLPDSIDAQRRHLPVLRRYDWAATNDGVLTALMICAHTWSVDGHPEPFDTWDTRDDRLDLLIPFDREKQDYVDYSTTRLSAAVYPQSRHPRPDDRLVLLAPDGRRLRSRAGPVLRGGRHTRHLSLQPARPRRRRHRALALADSWRPPSRPLTTYTPGRVSGTLPSLAANRLARHEKSAMWFSRRSPKGQGSALLFHGHLQPVLLRDRDPRYVKWEGTIWHSTRTDDLMKQEVARKRQKLERTAAA
ncbi:hypothetical protein [Streptomyces sp. NPDC008001]|uniref:hypothetical protein n=1 Tax=Streptomyces sp. NPDC008001 TaxID=3364804 RepID=UPI0036E02F6C